MKERKREKVGGGKEVLSPPLPYPAPLPFILAHFFFPFSQLSEGLLQVTMCIPSFPTFYGQVIFNLSVVHFSLFATDQQEWIW